MAFCKKKNNKTWIFKALDRNTKKVVAWVIGKRNIATVKLLYEKLKHIKNCNFYTDSWKAFKEVLPADRHIVSKKETHLIESDNSNTRHFLARMTRRTKVVTKCINMLNYSLKMLYYLSDNSIYDYFRRKYLSIFV